jgi:tRNA-dihydrouridine synthase A
MTMSHRFCVAPMMDWTDRHCRVFHRLITRRALLYTEMVTTGAVIYGDRNRLIGFDPIEHPLALQLGGSDPADLATATRIAEEWGYDEVNLNVGCPSDRVQSGRFGACLMAEPSLVAESVSAMREAVKIPLTVKSRIGIDDQDPTEVLPHFIETVAKAGCTTFVVHARKALLEGLSPKENRDVPPLDYQIVYDVKRSYPDLTIILNGGIPSLDASEEHLKHVDGVMLGRAAYQTPWILSDVDHRFFGDPPDERTPKDIIAAFRPYVAARLGEGVPLAAMTRHILGLFHGRPGARLFRRHLAENAHKRGAGLAVIGDAVALVDAATEQLSAA